MAKSKPNELAGNKPAASGAGNEPNRSVEQIAAEARAAAEQIGKPIERKDANGDGRIASEAVNPASVGGTGAPEKRGRGRPRHDGTAARPKNKTVSEPLTEQELFNLAAVIVFVHGVAAAWLNVPALAINDADGQLLAKASKSIFDHYNYTPAALKGPWMEVASALGQVYGGKIFEAMVEAKMKTPAPSPQPPITPKAPDADDMIDIPGVGKVAAGSTQFQGGPQL